MIGQGHRSNEQDPPFPPMFPAETPAVIVVVHGNCETYTVLAGDPELEVIIATKNGPLCLRVHNMNKGAPNLDFLDLIGVIKQASGAGFAALVSCSKDIRSAKRKEEPIAGPITGFDR